MKKEVDFLIKTVLNQKRKDIRNFRISDTLKCFRVEVIFRNVVIFQKIC